MDEALRAFNLLEGFHNVLVKSSEFCKIQAGAIVGGLQRNPATLSKVTMVSMLMDDDCTHGGDEVTSQ
jgi:hypothetical protein